MGTMNTDCCVLFDVERLKADPWFLANPLAVYCRRFGLTDADLACRLRCSPVMLGQIMACARPRTIAGLWSIARDFGVNGAVLSSMVKL
jgi:transcriptional regulator with XRE-family HTH domain